MFLNDDRLFEEIYHEFEVLKIRSDLSISEKAQKAELLLQEARSSQNIGDSMFEKIYAEFSHLVAIR
jgi:hypothetical protein